MPTQKPAPPAPVYKLKWVSARSYTEPEWNLAYCEGEVKNISNHSLHSVIVVVSWYDAADNFITSDWDFIQYDPLLSEQTSPYKVISAYNPAMAKVKIGFQEFGGAAIPTK